MAKNFEKVVQARIYQLVRIAVFVQWSISHLHLDLSSNHPLKIVFLL
jgi:hypothetical protein